MARRHGRWPRSSTLNIFGQAFNQDQDHVVIDISNAILASRHGNQENSNWFNRQSFTTQVRLAIGAVAAAGHITGQISHVMINRLMHFYREGGLQKIKNFMETNPEVAKQWADERGTNIIGHMKQRLRGAAAHDKIPAKKAPISEVSVSSTGEILSTPNQKPKVTEPNMSATKRFRTDDHTRAIIPPGFGFDDDEPMTEAAEAKSSNISTHKETPVLNPPDVMKSPFLNTLTIEMKSNIDLLMRVDTTNDNAANFRIRGTCYTDPLLGRGTSAWSVDAVHGSVHYQNEEGVNLPYGYQSATSQPVCSWTPFMKQLYEKYHVLSCHYDVTFENSEEVRGNNYQVFLKKYGEQAFPTLTTQYEIDNHNSEIKQLENNRFAGHNAKSTATFNGVYKAGDYGEDVINDALHETWTSVGSLPAYSEGLEFTIRNDRTSISNQPSEARSVYVRMNLKYIVQFKGLKQQFRWFNRDTTVMANDGVFGYQFFGKYP